LVLLVLLVEAVVALAVMDTLRATPVALVVVEHIASEVQNRAATQQRVRVFKAAVVETLQTLEVAAEALVSKVNLALQK
jgi:Skp family chaperone for outer membrane proteins